MRIIVDREVTGLPADLTDDVASRTAISDFLTRRFAGVAHRMVPRPEGTGNGGFVGIDQPGQEVLGCIDVAILTDRVGTRIDVGPPASGRRARGYQAVGLLTDLPPRVAEVFLLHWNLDRRALREHVTLLRDQGHLRGLLSEHGLVTFVGDGAILPRRSGNSDPPLAGEAVVPFKSLGNLRITFDLPSDRRVTGMGVPEGVTVIVGGGYHGKSTLLRAIGRGIYPHIGGDGREWVITRPDAITIRAEDSRAVTGVDISPFVTNLPPGTDTCCSSATNASGPISQTANLVEAIKAGASALLIGEGTSATSFVTHNERMRALIPAAQEPITPFMDHIRPLYDELGTSTILVAEGSGAFFEVADHVIAVSHYVPIDVTEKAHEMTVAPSSTEATEMLNGPRTGRPGVASLPPSDTGEPAKVWSCTRIQYGRDDIDLTAVPQLVDAVQTQAIAHALGRIGDLLDDRAGMPEWVDELLHRIDEKGLDWLSLRRGYPGHLTRPRHHEILAAVNRRQGLRIRP